MAISKELLPPIVLRLIRSLRPTKTSRNKDLDTKTTGRERGPEYYDKVFLAGQRKHYKGRKPRISETSFMKPSLGTTLLTSNSASLASRGVATLQPPVFSYSYRPPRLRQL
jgi:hypothetical protein